MLKRILFMVIVGCIVAPAAWALKSADEQRKDWDKWLGNLKQEMIAKGISKKTINRAYQNDYFHEVKAITKFDRKQAEFMLTSDVYINKLVTAEKVRKAREHYSELKKEYQKLSYKTGVPLNYLVAFWGVETHFGYNKGNIILSTD